MSAYVAQGHSGDSGGDDRPPSHQANYLREIVRELLLHHPSWRQVLPEQKAGVMAKIGTQFDLRLLGFMI
ncbi:hypothetical protein Tco_1136799 [Tanacetum coccineum]